MSQSATEKAKAAIASAQSQVAAALAAAKSQDAIKQAAEQAIASKAMADQATQAIKAAADAASTAARWKQVEVTIEEALEHAGISGVDAQIDQGGFARLVGQVASEEDRQTAVAMAEEFQVTGLDVQLEVVAPPADSGPDIAAPADQPVKYKVKAGESWWGIAQRVYGDGQLYKSLKAANNNPKMIHPGTEIILPPKSALSK
jgi:nucleoid-associated protein YgaU